MGSFNIKCNFSDLAIEYGDEVVAIPIYKVTGYKPVEIYNNDKNIVEHGISNSYSRCHSNAFWHPILCPIFGKYDDYGCTELIEEKYNLERVSDFFETIFDGCYNTIAGTNQYHEHGFDRIQFKNRIEEKGLNEAWQIIQQLMWEGRLFKRSFGKPVELGLMVISKLSYDTIINSQFFEYTNNSVDEMYDNGVTEIKEELQKYMNANRKFTSASIWYTFGNKRPYAWNMNSMENNSSYEVFNNMKNRTEYADNMIDDPEAMRNHIVPYIAAAKVITIMDHLNKLVIPVMTCGQEFSYENELYNVMHAIHHAKKFIRRKDCAHGWILPFSKEQLENGGGTFPICKYCDDIQDGWYCPVEENLDKICEYDSVNDPSHDGCIYCGLPSERK